MGTLDIHYKLINSIKGQVLADFVVEFTPSSRVFVGMYQVTVRLWRVYVDGASNERVLGIEIVMVSPKGVRLEKSLNLGFQASNNEALIARLRAIQKLRAKEVEMFSYSILVVSQIDKRFEAKGHHMSQHLKLYKSPQVNFWKVSVVRVPRS